MCKLVSLGARQLMGKRCDWADNTSGCKALTLITTLKSQMKALTINFKIEALPSEKRRLLNVTLTIRLR